VTGATGFVGERLAAELGARGVRVRCLSRSADRAAPLRERGYEVRIGDVLDRASLEGAGDGVDVAYYLVHSMAAGGDFGSREREGARNFARMASAEGISRVAYLGGLGRNAESKHLRSRHLTAEVLAAEGPPLTYFRAGMVVGPRSESFRTLRYLVERLPAMVTPAWLDTRTQPIGIDDVVAYLARAPEVGGDGEVEIGGPDVLTYREMLDRMADALGRRHPVKVRVPVLSPRLSSLWLGLITPVNANVARPLVESLTTETVVTDPEPARAYGVDPASFDDTLRRALAASRE
jgi:uncharacterized protein YbjT (DUF2867 family)